jgi:hypothetical protein
MKFKEATSALCCWAWMNSGGACANGFFRATAAAEMGVFRNELNDETATSGDSGERGCESISTDGLGTETAS